MNRNLNRNAFGVATILILFVLLAGLIAACGAEPAGPVPLATNEGPRERIGLNTRTDSAIYNGADIVFYSNDHISQTLALYGDSGNVDAEGDVDIAGNLEVTGVITGTSIVSTSLSYAATGNVTAGDDLIATDDLTVGDNAVISGTLTVVETTTLNGAVAVGVAGTGADVYFYSGTSGDHLFWDASDEVLNIVGTNAQTALNVSDGTVVIADGLTVTGATALNGGLTMDTSAFTVADTSGNVATAGTWEVGGASTLAGALTVNAAAEITGTLTYGAYAVSWSDPITITGVLTNIRILFYQVP